MVVVTTAVVVMDMGCMQLALNINSSSSNNNMVEDSLVGLAEVAMGRRWTRYARKVREVLR